MAAASKDETVRLGFGADDKVKIERTVLKRSEGSSGLIVTTSKTDERAFKTTVRNGHDFPLKVAIEDQLPVSENEEIVVEMLPSTRRRPRAICATSAACWNGRSRPRPARSGISALPGVCDGQRTRAS
jgi:uncharacterized protein (TIGR02231 family)